MKKLSAGAWVVLFLASWAIVDIIVDIADAIRGY